jgi:signal peptidase II
MNDPTEPTPAPGLVPPPSGAAAAPDAPATPPPATDAPLSAAAAPGAASPAPAGAPHVNADPLGGRPTYVFFGIVAAVSLIIDVTTKAWAEIELSKRLFSPSIVLIKEHLSFTLAYNRGGAWGLLQNASETVRKPFFLLVSALAIAFIVSLYSRLAPGQRALKWGLPLVLGGALGNLSDRITRSQVIDFIDYRADWILAMNRGIAKLVPSWGVTDHWPTFNVADIAICIGVGLMAVDMITARRSADPPASADPAQPKAVA